MVELSNIKIITGYKGGVGKTLISLAETIYAIRNNAKVLVIDLNANNRDLIDVLTNLYSSDFREFGRYKRYKFPIDNTSKQLIAIEPIEPQWDANQIWKFVIEVINREKHNASIMIVDTHLSISHLSPDTITMLDIYNKLKIETYHIWNLASPDKAKEMESIQKSIKKMEEALGNASYPSKNQIHIFNPHEAKSPRTYFNRRLRRRWAKNQRQKKQIAISIDTLIKLIDSVNIEFDYKTEISPSKLFETWLNFFSNLLEIGKRKAILNILPIFEYFDLSNFMVGQIYSKNRNIRGIQDDMSHFYRYISAFETMRFRKK